MRLLLPAMLGLSALTLMGCQPSTHSAETADAIWYQGTVITINDESPSAEAVAVKNGRILAVGPEKEVLRHQSSETQMHSLHQQTLLPGFVDAHGHLSFVGFQALSANLLPAPDGQVNSFAQLAEQLHEFADDSYLLKEFGVLYGFGYDDSQLEEKAHPTRALLDQVSTEFPILTIHQSAHFGALNSAALAKAGIDAQTPNPPGGVIVKDPITGEPTGVLEENAFYMALGKLFPQMTPKQAMDMLKKGEQSYISYGYTTLQDGRSSAKNVKLSMAAAEAGLFAADVVSYPDILVDGTKELLDTPYFQDTRTTPIYQHRFRIGGVKLTLDGSPQGKTAWLSTPYHVPPSNADEDYAGYGVVDDDVVIDVFTEAFSKHWQILTHANGDRAIDQLIMAAEKAQNTVVGADVRPVLIHGQTLRKDQVKPLKQLGVVPSLYPMHTYYWGDWHRDSVLGPERAENISPTGWVLNEDMRFTSHHDAPVVLPNAIRVLDATVNRTTRSGRVLGKEHKVDVATALKAMTLWAAWQHFEEDTKGSVEVGKLADFVVLSDNPLAVDESELINLSVKTTIKEGEIIYQSED